MKILLGCEESQAVCLAFRKLGHEAYSNDPFNGSGSTGKACMLEDVHYVGIDITPEYMPISEARISHALRQSKVLGKQLEL